MQYIHFEAAEAAFTVSRGTFEIRDAKRLASCGVFDFKKALMVSDSRKQAWWLDSISQAICLEAFAMLPVLHHFGSKIFSIEDEANLTDQYIVYFQAQFLASLILNDAL